MGLPGRLHSSDRGQQDGGDSGTGEDECAEREDGQEGEDAFDQKGRMDVVMEQGAGGARQQREELARGEGLRYGSDFPLCNQQVIAGIGLVEDAASRVARDDRQDRGEDDKGQPGKRPRPRGGLGRVVGDAKGLHGGGLHRAGIGVLLASMRDERTVLLVEKHQLWFGVGVAF